MMNWQKVSTHPWNTRPPSARKMRREARIGKGPVTKRQAHGRIIRSFEFTHKNGTRRRWSLHATKGWRFERVTA